MARQLFGTDGIRGVAGEFPLDSRTAFAFGCALGRWSAAHSPTPEVVIGMDTRESSTWLAEAVAGGLALAGVKTRFAGLITTPGVAWLTRTGPFVAGVMISASHNPYRDNGLKAFDHSGFKLPDDQEHLIEQDIFAILESDPQAQPQSLTVDPGLDAQYLDYLVSTTSARLDGFHLIADCANGAASHLAVDLFTRLGARVEAIGCEPNGRNINLNCGALHVQDLQKEVIARGAHAGLAFDGDADRCILVAGSGRVVDGDAVLWIVARHQKLNAVVATVMSNLGLEHALKGEGIRMLRTPVGDKYVLEEMERQGIPLGGEQSGHVIFRRFATTGDGMLTALRVLEIAALTGQSVDALAAGFSVYPQLLVNVRVKERKPLQDLPVVQQKIVEAEQSFNGNGRIVVRFSGTEPLARVMVEGPDEQQVRHHAETIAAAIRAELGG